MVRSTVLLGETAANDRRVVRDILSGAGWDVVEAQDAASLLSQACEHRPALTLLDDVLSDDRILLALRAAALPLRTMPILAFTRDVVATDALWARGLDGRIAKPASAAALVAAVAPWRPAGELAGAHRLAELFGEAAIVPLVARFGAQLADAVGGLGTTVSADVLHRLAGVAGTLGFDRICASWEGLSQGDVAILPVARREARLVLAQLDRDPRFATLG